VEFIFTTLKNALEYNHLTYQIQILNLIYITFPLIVGELSRSYIRKYNQVNRNIKYIYKLYYAHGPYTLLATI